MRYKHNTLLAMALALTAAVASLPASLKGTWNLSAVSVTYKTNHPLKSAAGTSQAARGKVRCAATSCEALIAVAVNSFDSGDSNRDLHMLETTRGAAHPMILVRSRFTVPASGQPVLADLEIEFAGEKAIVKNVSITLKQNAGNELEAAGHFVLRLSDFKITPPSLLGMAIRNDVPIDFKSTWKQ